MRVLLPITGVVLVIACGSLEAPDAPPAVPDAGDDVVVPAPPPPPDAGVDAGRARVTSISAGESFACALREDGSVACWGSNNQGTIGQPPDGDFACDSSIRCRPAPVDVPGIANATQISVGYAHACARVASGDVLCWGWNANGTLGNGTTMPPSRATPAKIPLPGPALDVSGGGDGSCARVSEDGGVHVYCWGTATSGLVGAPIASGVVRGPTRIPGLDGATQVSLSVIFGIGCAVLADASVVCWGLSTSGNLGHVAGTAGDTVCGSNYCNATPSPIGDATFKALDVAVGAGTACARTLDGGVACWGTNIVGGLGQGGVFDTNDNHTPKPIPSLAGASALSFRWLHGCALVSGEVLCWGGDAWGELGDGLGGAICGNNVRCRTTPVKIPNLSGITHLAAGASFTVVADDTNDGWAWGANIDGRLGHAPGTANDIATCGPGSARCNPNPQPLGF